jgi:hypothetical protein
LCNSVLDFYQPQIFTTISLVLVFGYWLGFGLTMHALQGIWIQFQLGRAKNKEILESLLIIKMEIIMENKFQEEERYFRAKKRVDEIKGFIVIYLHVFVNLGLLALNLWDTNHLWFYWPLLGIGVIIHGVKVFNLLFLAKIGKLEKKKRIHEEEQLKKQNNYK